MNAPLVVVAKILSTLSRTFNLGNGSTWPGHIALSINPHIVEDVLKNSHTQTILIAGTNGKTTTGKILSTLLEEDRKKVIQNTSGANLLNGIASTFLTNTSKSGQLTADYAVFEVDENNVPIVLQHLTPKIIIALDLFRDQLDRYGELDSISKKWNAAFQRLTDATTLVLNSDDPLIAYLAKDVKAKVVYFGLDSSHPRGEDNLKSNHTPGVSAQLDHASDSIYCPNCGTRLIYKKIFFSHLGIWECPHCGVKRPLPTLSESLYPLPGAYNKYNTLAAVLAAKTFGVSQKIIDDALAKVVPAFGRQEKLIYKGKQVQVFLSKNPVSMNESIETIIELNSKFSLALKKGEGQGEGGSRQARTKVKPTILFVLNDRVPDGRDISWIWDIAMEEYVDKFKSIFISGDRCYDLALRIQYSQAFSTPEVKRPNTSGVRYFVESNLREAIDTAIESVPENETLYILPTYSAMLEVRKILTGRKIL